MTDTIKETGARMLELISELLELNKLHPDGILIRQSYVDALVRCQISIQRQVYVQPFKSITDAVETDPDTEIEPGSTN